MNKELRMMETAYYHYVNVNPKGKHVGDCVVRAIALACGQSWEQTIREMTELGIKKGLVLNDKKLYPMYLQQKGFIECSEPRDANNCKMTINNWVIKGKHYNGIYVANAGSHHLTAIIDGKVCDTWNASHQTMHKYWKKGI